MRRSLFLASVGLALSGCGGPAALAGPEGPQADTCPTNEYGTAGLQRAHSEPGSVAGIEEVVARMDSLEAVLEYLLTVRIVPQSATTTDFP